MFVSWNKMQGACADVFTRPTLLRSYANGRIIVALRFAGHRTKEMLGLVTTTLLPDGRPRTFLSLMIVVKDNTGGGNACGRRCKSHTTAVSWPQFINPPLSQHSSPPFLRSTSHWGFHGHACWKDLLPSWSSCCMPELSQLPTIPILPSVPARTLLAETQDA